MIQDRDQQRGPVLDFDPQTADRAVAGPAETRERPGTLELLPEQWRVARDENHYVQQERLREQYEPVIAALVESGVERDSLLAYSPSYTGMSNSGDYDRAKVWRAILRLRESDPRALGDLPATQIEFEREMLTRQGARQVDQAEIARGSTGAQLASGLLGGGAAEMTKPFNIATIAVGGGGRTVAIRLATEFLAQATIEAAQTGGFVAAREALGEDATAEEILINIFGAGVAGATLRGGMEFAPKIDAAMYDSQFATKVRQAIDGRFRDRDLANALGRAVPVEARTPEQQMVIEYLLREAEIDEDSPFARTYAGEDTHRAKLQAAMRRINEGRPPGDVARASDEPVTSIREIDPDEAFAADRPAPPEPVERGPDASPGPIAPDAAAARNPATPRNGAGYDAAAVKAAIRVPESAGRDNAVNGMGSSASGRYQFIRLTFKRLYRKVYGTDEAATAKAWEERRFEPAIQERLMDELLKENAAVLGRGGVEPTTGNLYLAHFAGPEKAVELLSVARDRPVKHFFGAEAIAQNPTYLGGGRTVGEALDAIFAAVGARPSEGGPSRGVLEGFDLGDEPYVRPDALDAERPAVPVGDGVVPIEQFRAADIEVDAELMQFKSGGDAFGVTERLQGVEEWDPHAAGVVTVWEGVDGRRLIADGHQRLGLAKRLSADGGSEISLNAFVLRESDGFSAGDARIVTALKNIGEGTGTAADAAKVFREAGIDGDEALRRLPPRSALVRDGKALARLDDEAFGAVINEVIPENYGAAIGSLVEDRALHGAMVRILAETEPPNPVQAEAIIRQAREAGFTRETQDSLFGSEELVTGLFAHRAKLLDRALKELRKMKGAFAVAARNAETLEGGGNRIDVAGSEAAAADNARALALVDRLALRKGNAVNEIFDQAARRLADGEPLERVLRDAIGDLRKLDLADLARTADAADGAGRGAGGSGRAGEPEGPDRLEDGQLTPREADDAAARGETSTPIIDDDTAGLFDEPAGEGARLTAESAWHDIRQAEASMDDSTGPFGPVFEDVDPGDWPAVLDRLASARTGEVRGVLSHPKIGLIDVVWGKEGTGMSDGYGLAKISKFHPEVLDDLPAIVRNMDVAEQTATRVRLESADHKGAIGLDWHGEGKTWLLTAYGKRERSPSATDDGRAADASAARTGNFSALEDRPEIGALIEEGKGDAELFDLDDGKGARSAADIRSEIDADRAAIEEIRNCLK